MSSAKELVTALLDVERSASFHGKSAFEIDRLKTLSAEDWNQVRLDYDSWNVRAIGPKLTLAIEVISAVWFFSVSGLWKVLPATIFLLLCMREAHYLGHREGYVDGYDAGHEKGIDKALELSPSELEFIDEIILDSKTYGKLNL